ncbi:MAG: hypothetical protein JWO33_1003 [Caulobacteraceae bacterium]|nr:hypothetical protein [Caulobacteraceae bacterium]
MTWAGADYLDATRDPKIWKAAKAGAEKAGGFTLDVLKAFAVAAIKSKAKAIGIDLEV